MADSNWFLGDRFVTKTEVKHTKYRKVIEFWSYFGPQKFISGPYYVALYVTLIIMCFNLYDTNKKNFFHGKLLTNTDANCDLQMVNWWNKRWLKVLINRTNLFNRMKQYVSKRRLRLNKFVRLIKTLSHLLFHLLINILEKENHMSWQKISV